MHLITLLPVGMGNKWDSKNATSLYKFITIISTLMCIFCYFKYSTQRSEFDRCANLAQSGGTFSTANGANLTLLVRQLLFFYRQNEDSKRLVSTEHILICSIEIFFHSEGLGRDAEMDLTTSRNSFCWPALFCSLFRWNNLQLDFVCIVYKMRSPLFGIHSNLLKNIRNVFK